VIRSPAPGLPSTGRAAGAAAPAFDFRGVRISAPAQVGPGEKAIVTGVFVVPDAEARTIDERLHAALVVVCTSVGPWFVDRPFRDVMLFDDDEERGSGVRRGYFQFDLFEDSEVTGEFFLHVSLGHYLSNVATVLAI